MASSGSTDGALFLPTACLAEEEAALAIGGLGGASSSRDFVMKDQTLVREGRRSVGEVEGGANMGDRGGDEPVCVVLGTEGAGSGSRAVIRLLPIVPFSFFSGTTYLGMPLKNQAPDFFQTYRHVKLHFQHFEREKQFS